MVEKSRIACAVNRILLLSLFSLSGGGLAGPVSAADDVKSEPETVVVTGSRIATPELASPVPVTVVSTQLIQDTGTVNVSDILRLLPSVGSSVLSSTNSNFLVSGQGVNSINLRNLGDQRTLVLVNGRRFTPGVAGSSIVDFNMIPTDFVDHIEVITGGASAIYGSDALAGVVNVIYKKDFSGILTHFQGGATDQRDDARYLASLTAGDTLAEGRGHFMLNLSWDKDEGLKSSQRAISAVDDQVTNTGFTKPAYSSFAPQGRFDYSDAMGNFDNVFTFNPDNSLKSGFPSSYGFNRNAYRRISIPIDRGLVATSMDYDLSESQHFYSEVTYGVTHAHAQIEPFALASNLFANSVYGGASDPVTGAAIGVPITNAYLQTMPQLAPVFSQINTWNAANPTDPIQYIQFRKRLLDIADRTSDTRRQTFRTTIGVKGDTPLEGWTYDVSGVYGRTTDDDVGTGQANLTNLRFALDSVVQNGQIVCADTVAQALGCVPINIFGYNSITPKAAAWVNAPVTRNAAITEQVYNGYVTGPIAHLPGGPVTLVVGAEYRKDQSEEIWDSLTNLGLNGGNVLPNVFGSFNVKEAFTEVQVPILRDLPLAKKLDIDGAFRQANYSTVGSVHAWKAGLQWTPVSTLSFRGVYSQAIRAPDINELYGGNAQTFPSVSDPCNGATATSNGQYDAACRAIPGVANAIAKNGSFTYEQVDLQSVTGIIGSNTSLKQEKAKTTTLGLVFQPEFLPGFNATVDYYDIRIDGAVGTIPVNDSINQCLLTGSAVFCNNVIRDAPSGKVTAVNAINTNVGSIKTAGVDSVLRYLIDLNGTPVGGKLNLSLSETHLLQLEQTNFPGAPPTDNRGQLSGLGAGFEDRATFTADYQRGPIKFSWVATYKSSASDTLNQNGPVNALYNSVPAFVYHDVQAGYKFGSARYIEAYVGVNNLFNKQPPFLPEGMASTITGTETDATDYDVFGRFIYGGISAKF